MSLRLTDLTRNTLATAFSALLEGDNAPGVMRFYQGGKPSDVDDTSGGTLLGTATFGLTPFFLSQVEAGKLILFSQINDTTSIADGIPDWGTIEDAAGQNILDFDIPEDLNISQILALGSFSIRSLEITMPAEC